VLLLETVAARAREFDVIHYHTDYLHFPLSRRCSVPQVTTLHGRLDIPDLIPLYREFSDMPVISISHAQRKPLPWLNWQATIYHGLPVDLYHYHPDPRGHLAFIGRVSPDKGIAQAIEIAIALDMPLRIAAKIGESDREYFRSVIRPLLDHPLIEYVGEVGDREKEEILGDARAVLFPISWPEPFGLTMIESMACGTPVVAFNQGSVPEVIEHGKTGFLVSSLEEAVEAVKHIDQINRGACRAEFVRRFSADRIADDYARAYQQLAGLPAGLVAAGTLAGVAH
jgi:glycosyltransferase involved in cell wall biosynthesis